MSYRTLTAGGLRAPGKCRWVFPSRFEVIVKGDSGERIHKASELGRVGVTR